MLCKSGNCSLFSEFIPDHNKMPKLKIAVLVSASAVMSTLLFSEVVSCQTAKPSVRLKTEPPISQILPFQAGAKTPPAPVKLTLQAVDGTGKVLENAKINLKIITPAKNHFLPTDFPIVEGTELLNIAAIAPKGELQIQQMLPIRGNYQLLVNVTPIQANGFTPIQQSFTLPVSENWIKYQNFGILALILLGLGCGGGLVLGGKQEIELGEVVPQRVRLLLSVGIMVAIATLLIVNISTEIADSHPDHNHNIPQSNEPIIPQSQGIAAELTGTHQARVGQPAQLGVQVTNTITGQPAQDVLLKVKVKPTDEEWVAFAYQGIPDSQGKLIWQQQFFDGTPHRVEVEVFPQPQAPVQFSPLRVVKNIQVEGVAPPLPVRLIVLAYLTSIIVLGLLLGLKITNSSVWQFKR